MFWISIAILGAILVIIGIWLEVKNKRTSAKVISWIFAFLAFLISIPKLLEQNLPLNPISHLVADTTSKIEAGTLNTIESTISTAYDHTAVNSKPIETILLGTWQGTYNAPQGKVNAKLVLVKYKNDILYAVFSFFANPENPGTPSGSYTMQGYISNDLTINLKGQKWIERPGNYIFLDISGSLDKQKMIINSEPYDLVLSKVSNNTKVDINIDFIAPTKINDEGYLSSAILFRKNNVNGYMLNNQFSTLQGSGYENGYLATSGGKTYEHVISVCSYSPFELIYNLESKYKIISGKVAFDDCCKSGDDIVGLESRFQGEATVTFLSGDKEIKKIIIKTIDIPKSFNFNIKNLDQLIIKFDFPYANFVLENFNKYFNLIDVKIS